MYSPNKFIEHFYRLKLRREISMILFVISINIYIYLYIYMTHAILNENRTITIYTFCIYP